MLDIHQYSVFQLCLLLDDSHYKFQINLIFAHTGQPNKIPTLHKTLTKKENVAAHDHHVLMCL